MAELIAETSAEMQNGRILIVDDDPVVAGMLGASLAAFGYQIEEASSGEEVLLRLIESGSQALPDIVFLDIEMGMGIDGYETCRRLRETETTRHLPVIFISGHDELDDRLSAYDAGGSDFMAKPFDPAEVLRKARLAISHKRRQEAAEVEKRSSSDNAEIALTCLGDAELTQQFNRGAVSVRTLYALAQLTIDTMASFGISCHTQLRTPGEILTLTSEGIGSPLEESVIDKLRTMDRIFSFKNRMIVNYDSVSLLIPNMPVDDEEFCGRIRDQAAIIAEVAELAVGNILLRTDAIARADGLRILAESSREAILELRGSYGEIQMATRQELEAMTDTIENMYFNLGLTDRQEFTISDTVRGSIDRALKLLEKSNDLDRKFDGIVNELTKAGEYRIVEEEQAAPNIQLF